MSFVGHQPPPIFKRGPAPLARLFVFVAVCLALLVAAQAQDAMPAALREIRRQLPHDLLQFHELVDAAPLLAPWRRSEAWTWFSPAARVSPRTCLPLRSLPSHSNTYSLMSFDVAVAMWVLWCRCLRQCKGSMPSSGAQSIRITPPESPLFRGCDDYARHHTVIWLKPFT